MNDRNATPVPPRASPRLLAGAVALLLLPVAYVLGRSAAAASNIPLADDIDGTLMLLLRLAEGGSLGDHLRWLFEIHNEHRMVTSRLLHVVSYAAIGTVNFAVLAAIGNLFLIGLCALLVRVAASGERRLMLACLLVALLFQMQHYENFFWSGSSIDHFQVPLLAGAAVVLLANGRWLAGAAAAGFAVLAMFTLAHGIVLWPVGALVLGVERRWRQLAGWLAMGVLACALYFMGFDLNAAHQVGDFSIGGVGRIMRYWLQLLGAPLAFRHETLAAGLGAVLLILLGWQVKHGGLRRERIALPLALWAVAALGLIAIGRASLGDAVLISRYYVLSALAWALTLFVVLVARPSRPPAASMLRWLVPVAMGFNLAANLSFAGLAGRWVADRNAAVAEFVRHGRDGAGRTTLHPNPAHATRVIRQAEKRGVFVMPHGFEARTFPIIEAANFPHSVDEIAVDENVVTITGWAAIPGRAASPGDVHVVLRSTDAQHVLTTTGRLRPDVAAVFPGERWTDSGFALAVRRSLIPAENFQIGLLIPSARGAELVMTTQRVDLAGPAFALEKDKVAPDRNVYDELVLRTPATTVRSSPGKSMRVSFVDQEDRLVHVDFTGRGEMSVSLAESVALEPAPRVHGRPVAYLKGSASIAITGADESTSVGVFSVHSQFLQRAGIARRQGAHARAYIAAITIASRNGTFGGVRTGNVQYVARSGMVGIQAPSVHFTGPVNIGEITALGEAVPVIELGYCRETLITGGSLHQPNGRPVRVSGIARLSFVAGRTADGVTLPAQVNRAALIENGRDVSAEIAGRGAASRGSAQ